MNSLIFFIVCLIIRLIINDYNKPVVSNVYQIINTISNKEPIKYYSNGIELPYRFHIEYKIMIDVMADSWIYKYENQELVNQNHNSPIIDRKIITPYLQLYTYKLKNVFLAESNLTEHWDYLKYLN